MPANVVPRGNGKFGARVSVRGEMRWLGTFPSELEASEAVRLVRGGRSASGSVAAWFGEWPRLAAARRPRSRETMDRTLKLAAPFRARFGGVMLSSLTRGDVAAWALAHPANARYARTILADAVWAGKLDVSPFEGVRVPRGSGSAGVALSEADVRALCASAIDPHLRLLIQVCAYSGLRLSEALALEARDLDGDVVHVRDGKGGREGHAILFEPALSALQHCGVRAGRVFPAGWDRHSVNRMWRLLRARAGIVTPRFHDLRHFHATWLLARGVNRADVAAQLRHAGLRDVDRYLATRDPRAALERVRRDAA